MRSTDGAAAPKMTSSSASGPITDPASLPRTVRSRPAWKDERISVTALGLLVAAVGALNYVWLSYNTVPPHWDTANHMMSAMRYHAVLSECLSHPPVSFADLKHCLGNLVGVDQFVYPPLFPLVGGLIIFGAGNSINALAMTNLPFAAVLVTAMYFMGRTIHSRLAGLLAALLIIAYPLVFQMSREFMLDFATLAMAAAAACFLVLSDGFRRTGMTVLFGLATGLGALTKITLLTHLIGPGVYVLACLLIDISARRVDSQDAAKRLSTLAVGLALGLAVAALWYWPNREGFLGGLRAVTSLDVINAPVLSLPSLTYYPLAMIRQQMGPVLFLLFMYGAWRCARYAELKHRNLLLVWIASIYLIQTAVKTKDRTTVSAFSCPLH